MSCSSPHRTHTCTHVHYPKHLQFPALNEVPEEGEHSEGNDESPADAAESVSGESVGRTATTSQPSSQQRQIGPVMFIHAANVLRPAADVQLVDARQLSVACSAGDEEVDAQTATVSAFARPTLPPNRGRLLQVGGVLHLVMDFLGWVWVSRISACAADTVS